MIGHSPGGAVARRLPAPASGPPPAGARAALSADAAHRPERRRAILDMAGGARRPAARPDRMVARSPARGDAKAFRTRRDSWTGEVLHADAEACEVPALAVAGELGPALSPEATRQTWRSWYPRAEFVALPSAVHHAMDERPPEGIGVVEDFLRADAEDPAVADAPARVGGPA